MTLDEFVMAAGCCLAAVGLGVLTIEFFRWALTLGVVGFGVALFAAGFILVVIGGLLATPAPCATPKEFQ